MRANYERLTNAEMAKALGRSKDSVATEAIKHLGLRKDRKHRSLAARFDHHTTLRPLDGCWVWEGNFTADGYGVLTYGAQRWLAHRLSVYLRDGRLARSIDVLHRCDNKPCVNPAHLYVGDDSANQRDIATRTFRKNQRLTPEDVRVIRRRFLSGGVSKQELAKEYGCVVSNIHALLIGRSWSWVRDGNSA